MIESNTPYVKRYNEKGELQNPIKGKYVSKHPNRAARRRKTARDFNNKKSTQLVTTNTDRYLVRVQKILISLKNKVKFKPIVHYVHRIQSKK